MQVKNILYLILLAGLAGCATLPSSGPTGGQIAKTAAAPKDGTAPIQIVLVRTIADVPGTDVMATAVLPELAPPPTDMIGPGDVLDINIYEAGVTLFSGAGGGGGGVSQITANPGVQVQKLPPTRVDDLGDITIPYAGTLHVAGITTGEVEAMTRNALSWRSADADR